MNAVNGNIGAMKKTANCCYNHHIYFVVEETAICCYFHWVSNINCGRFFFSSTLAKHFSYMDTADLSCGHVSVLVFISQLSQKFTTSNFSLLMDHTTLCRIQQHFLLYSSKCILCQIVLSPLTYNNTADIVHYSHNLPYSKWPGTSLVAAIPLHSTYHCPTLYL